MSASFDINKFRKTKNNQQQYFRQLHRLDEEGLSTESVEKAVQGAIVSLAETTSRAFVIYGEPQSGKTEMMICLTAKLADEGYKVMIHMLNDSVDLLDQNLGRFLGSGLAPSPQNLNEATDPSTDLKSGTHVIFCKKNAHNLRDLIKKLDGHGPIVVIDDEADYATPNSKVNKKEKTTINSLVEQVIGDEGQYIGVTATPARLNLNNTFANDSSLWVKFPPHPMYTGQDTFFPMDLLTGGLESIDYILTLIPDKGTDPKYERGALLSFLVNVAHLNLTSDKERNYSLLVHTSGQKVDHKLDLKVVKSTFAVLDDENSEKYENYVEQIWKIAKERYPDSDPDVITSYILSNTARRSILVLNSEPQFKKVGQSATNPAALFTIIIGGNIVSRGVTFNNLLSMFFTRDVKHKLQQDTYIQRARMFGSRGKYLKHFELTIPQHLFLDWHRCFVYHRLALASIDSDLGSPVWVSDKRIAAVASPSIDQSTVDMDKGEMSFAMFDFDPAIDALIDDKLTPAEKVARLAGALPGASFPSYLQQFILQSTSTGKVGLKVFGSGTVFPSMTDEEKERIERRRGFMTIREEDRNGGNAHFIRIFRNDQGMARLFYKLEGSVQFLKNVK
jgi:hypothetical protein